MYLIRFLIIVPIVRNIYSCGGDTTLRFASGGGGLSISKYFYIFMEKNSECNYLFFAYIKCSTLFYGPLFFI